MASSSSTAERRDLQSKDRRAWNSYAAQRRMLKKELRTREQEKKKLEELLEGYQYVIKSVVEPLVRDLKALRQFSADMELTASTVTEIFKSVCLLGATVAKHKHEACHMEERIQKVEGSIIESSNPNKNKGKVKHNKTRARKKASSTIAPRPKSNTTTSSRKEEVSTTTRRELPEWAGKMYGRCYSESDPTSSSHSDSTPTTSTEEFYDRHRVFS